MNYDCELRFLILKLVLWVVFVVILGEFGFGGDLFMIVIGH